MYHIQLGYFSMWSPVTLSCSPSILLLNTITKTKTGNHLQIVGTIFLSMDHTLTFSLTLRYIKLWQKVWCLATYNCIMCSYQDAIMIHLLEDHKR